MLRIKNVSLKVNVIKYLFLNYKCGETKGIDPVEHKKEGMINVVNKRCRMGRWMR